MPLPPLEPPPVEPLLMPAPLVVVESPPPLMVPEVLPLDIEPLVLLVVGVDFDMLPMAPPVPLDMLLGPEPMVPWVAGAVDDEVWASAMPEQLMERAMARPRSLRDIGVS